MLTKTRISTWVKAFKGFYDKNDPIAQQDLVARLLFSARSLILVISAQAAVIAGLLAYVDGKFNPISFPANPNRFRHNSCREQSAERLLRLLSGS